MGKYNKILFCTDFSDLSDVAFDFACDFVQLQKGDLYLFHSTTEPPIKGRMDKIFKEKYLDAACYAEKCEGVKTECVTRQGLDHEQIVKYAKEADMDIIVMGTHGQSGFFGDILVGSCARQVVRRSTIPVVVVPAPARAKI